MAAEFIITFSDAVQAIKAEHILLKTGLNVHVMHLPPSMRVGCGLSLRLPLPEKEQAMSLLQKNEIYPQQIYSRTKKNGKSEYSILNGENNGE